MALCPLWTSLSFAFIPFPSRSEYNFARVCNQKVKWSPYLERRNFWGQPLIRLSQHWWYSYGFPCIAPSAIHFAYRGFSANVHQFLLWARAPRHSHLGLYSDERESLHHTSCYSHYPMEVAVHLPTIKEVPGVRIFFKLIEVEGFQLLCSQISLDLLVPYHVMCYQINSKAHFNLLAHSSA